MYMWYTQSAQLCAYEIFKLQKYIQKEITFKCVEILALL